MQALYGLNSAGAAFRKHLVDCIHHLVFLPCPADVHIWMKAMLRIDDGLNYYAYVLIYVYTAMGIHNNAECVIRIIDKYFKLNPSLIGDPDICLGAKLKKMRL